MTEDRIAALIGDFYHEAAPMRAALETAAQGQGFSIDFFTDPAALPWNGLSQYSLLVMAREGRVAPLQSKAVWNTDSHERAIADFVAAGGGLVGLHAGLAYGHTGTYGQTLRGSFAYHPEELPEFQVRPLGVPHVLLEGFREFSVRDEMYFVRVDSTQTTRLLEVVSSDYGSSSAAWAHALGKGRVFCFTPGHQSEVLSDPAYLRFLGRGIRWASGRL
jgi:type 1 glutamine amidotransferase